MRGSLKYIILRGEFTKNEFRGEDCLKKEGDLGSLSIEGQWGGLARKKGCCFSGGFDNPMHTIHDTSKSMGIKVNTWKYDLPEQLNKIIELNRRGHWYLYY